MSNEERVHDRREINLIVAMAREGMQDVRIALKNRIRDFIRKKNEGIAHDAVEEKKEQKDYSKKYSDKKLPGILKSLIESGKLSKEDGGYMEKAIEMLKKVEAEERKYGRMMMKIISSEPVWENYLFRITGIGHLLSAKLILMLGNCEKFDNVGKLWAYFGYHVVCPVCTDKRVLFGKDTEVAFAANAEGICSKCGKRGIAPRRRVGVSLGFKSTKRTFAYNIGESLIRCKSPVYYRLYTEEKKKQLRIKYRPGVLKKMSAPVYRSDETNLYKQDSIHLTPKHAHARAMRKMIKIFLANYWVVSRLLVKMDVREPYSIEKQGHTTVISWEEIMRANGVNPEDVLKSVA